MKKVWICLLCYILYILYNLREKRKHQNFKKGVFFFFFNYYFIFCIVMVEEDENTDRDMEILMVNLYIKLINYYYIILI
jgi:hypothetical protein